MKTRWHDGCNHGNRGDLFIGTIEILKSFNDSRAQYEYHDVHLYTECGELSICVRHSDDPSDYYGFNLISFLAQSNQPWKDKVVRLLQDRVKLSAKEAT